MAITEKYEQGECTFFPLCHCDECTIHIPFSTVFVLSDTFRRNKILSKAKR